jgi:hypothetical protein
VFQVVIKIIPYFISHCGEKMNAVILAFCHMLLLKVISTILETRQIKRKKYTILDNKKWKDGKKVGSLKQARTKPSNILSSS